MSEITYGRGSAGLGIILGLFIYDNDLRLKFFENFTNNITRLKRLSACNKAAQKTRMAS